MGFEALTSIYEEDIGISGAGQEVMVSVATVEICSRSLRTTH